MAKVLHVEQLPGEAFAEARRVAGLTQRELARRVGVTARTIQNLESGSGISSAVRRLVSIELFIAAAGRDPFNPNEEA